MGGRWRGWVLDKVPQAWLANDWSVDKFNAHPQPLLIAIKEKMVAQFEYRSGLRGVLEEVFF